MRLKSVFLDELTEPAESLTQLKVLLNGRIQEGNGETIFDLGLEDNGDSLGFTEQQWKSAYAKLEKASEDLGAACRILFTKNVGGDVEIPLKEGEVRKDKTCSGKVLVRRRPKNIDDTIETRIAVVGNVDAGKSTLLGVLVKGGLDDGRGKMRINLFRHKHEAESGRTSSVGMEIMGFDAKGDVVSSAVPGRKLSWEEIGKRAVRY